MNQLIFIDGKTETVLTHASARDVPIGSIMYLLNSMGDRFSWYIYERETLSNSRRSHQRNHWIACNIDAIPPECKAYVMLKGLA